MPPLGWLFVGLAILDVVGRYLGFIAPWILIVGVSDPFAVLTQVFPRALVILLPVFILGQASQAARTAPRVLRGALLLAIAELVAPSAMRVTYETLAPQNLFVWTCLLVLWTLAKAVAWVMIGVGLRWLAPTAPTPNVARWSNLVAGALVAGALFQVVRALTGAAAAHLDGSGDGVLRVLGWTSFVPESFALAFVARVVIRGSGDIRRSALATRVAVAAFGVLAAVALIDLTLAIATVIWITIGPFFVLGYGSGGGGIFGGGEIVWFSFPILGGWTPSIAMSAFLLSFAVGLARTSSRPLGASPAEEHLQPSPATR